MPDAVYLLVAVLAVVVTLLVATAGPRHPPDSWRAVGKLVPGDVFADGGREYVVLGAGFEQLRDGPGEVPAVDVGLGRLEKFPASYEVRWLERSDQAVRDWDEERGR